MKITIEIAASEVAFLRSQAAAKTDLHAELEEEIFARLKENAQEDSLEDDTEKGKLPFGTAVKGAGKTYSYYISPKLFMEFTGCTIEEIQRACKE